MSHNAAYLLRSEADTDREFLFRLFSSTRTDVAALVDWSRQQKDEFLRQQFNTQHQYFQQKFPDCAFSVVTDPRGKPIGRLYVDRRVDEIRIVDIALIPKMRGKGIGGAIMKAILDEARLALLPVRIHVEEQNPAFQMYLKLGFRNVGHTEFYVLMEWSPEIVLA